MSSLVEEVFAAVRNSVRLGRPRKEPARDSRPFVDLLPGPQNKEKAKPAAGIQTLRNLSREPNVRKAMNLIINPILQMKWTVRPKEGFSLSDENVAAKCRMGRAMLRKPNSGETWRKWVYRLLDEAMTVGYATAEQKESGDPDRPWRSWTMDAGRIKVNAAWNGDPDAHRFTQKNGVLRKDVKFDDRHVIFMTPDPTTYSEFGTGPVEYVYNRVNDFLTAYEQSAAIAGDAMPGAMIDMGEGATEKDVADLRAYIKAYVEGKSRWPIIGGKKQIQVLKLFKGDSSDTRIEWLEFLLTQIANGFLLSPSKMGVGTTAVARGAAEEQGRQDDLSAVKPWASMLKDHIDNDVFEKLLGWTEVEFVWLDLEKEDQERDSRIHKTYLDGDTVTPNEVREALGKDPIKNPIYDMCKTERMILLAQARGTAAYKQIPGMTIEEQVKMNEELTPEPPEPADQEDDPPAPEQKQGVNE